MKRHTSAETVEVCLIDEKKSADGFAMGSAADIIGAAEQGPVAIISHIHEVSIIESTHVISAVGLVVDKQRLAQLARKVKAPGHAFAKIKS